MLFAPAMGIACLQVLAAMCAFVAALFAVLGVKNALSAGEGIAPASAFLFAAGFVAGALACLWFAGVIRRMARGE